MSASLNTTAKFPIGAQVRHRLFGFRGVIFDVDPEFNNSEEWYQSIPEDIRPAKEQPFYHLFAQDQDDSPYIAYVSEQNLVPEENDEPFYHPELEEYFEGVGGDGQWVPRVRIN